MKLGAAGARFRHRAAETTVHLNSVIMNKFPKTATPVLRELRTLADAIDQFSTGHFATTADLATHAAV